MKQCFACTKKLTKEYFTVPAWKESKPERRVCLHCQKRENGNAHAATKKCQRNSFPITAKCRARMAGKRVMLVVTLSCPCRALVVQATLRKRLPGLAHNVCNLWAKGFAFAKFSAKRGKRSPRTCALERKKPPLQPISQKQQKRTLSRSNKYHITNVCLPSLRQSYKIHNSYRRSANTRTLRMTVSCQEWCSM